MKQPNFCDIQVRPLCDNDERYVNNYCLDFFDQRTDFLLFKRIASVAVLLNAELPAARPRKRPAVRPVRLSLYDTTAGRTVTTIDTALVFEPGEEEAIVRCDIPVEYDDIDPDHDYAVQVLDAHDRFMEERCIRFFKVVTVPHREMQVMAAWMADGPRQYRQISCDNHGWVEVVFDVCNQVDRGGRVPELWVRTVFSDGDESMNRCSRAVSDGTVCCSQYSITTYLSSWMPTGETYYELQLFGFPIAAFSIDTSLSDMPGHLMGEEVAAIQRNKKKEGAFWHGLIKEAQRENRDSDSNSNSDFDHDSDHDSDRDEDTDIDFDLDTDTDSDSENENDEQPQVSAEQAHNQLERMVGLETVKTKLNVFENMVRFSQLRKQAGLPTAAMPLHAMFLGAPGTGKTTVAKIIGRILADIGVLSKGHVVVRDRATLTGQFYSSEAEKTLEALEEAQGGILFIDEAYQLCQPADPKDPGHFVLDTLMTALADDSKRDWMLILAGYTKPTKKLLEMNPGLSSRIPESNHYTFDDFTAPQLMEIAKRWIEDNKYMLTPHATDALTSLLAADYENKDEHFGNARHVMNLLETQVLPMMACRVMKQSGGNADEQNLRVIHRADIPAPRENVRKQRRMGFATC